MPEPLTTIAALTATMAGIRKIASSSVEYLGNFADEKWQLKKAENIVRNIADRIIEIRKVKTILDLENEVELGDFYSPQHVRVGLRRYLVTTINALPYDGNTVFTGVAGQGKSVFFRYLASRVPEDGKSLPLFIELRRLAHQDSLQQLIEKELEVLGFPTHPVIFSKLAEAGNIVLFLDAFDEIPVDKQSKFVADIEDLCRKFRDLRVLISSRPNNGIESSPEFRSIQLDNLRNDEYQQIVRKLSDSEVNALPIIQGVEQEDCRIASLLTTPLMVTLLVLRYKVDASIPDNEEAFYGDLFDLLARRHDKTKAGFIRDRRTDATEMKLERLFSGVCFLSLVNEDVEISRQRLAGYSEKSAKVQAINIDAEKAILDVVDITCLLLEEAGIFQFPHRTIQEFFAAKFLKDQPDETKRKFYRRLIENWESWDQTLQFLEILDSYQFQKQFVLPNARRWLTGNVGGDPDRLSSAKRKNAVDRIFASGIVVLFRTQNGDGVTINHAIAHSIFALNDQFFLLRKLAITEDISKYLKQILDEDVGIIDLRSIATSIQEEETSLILHVPLQALVEDARFPKLKLILTDAIDECIKLFVAVQGELRGVDSLADLFED